MNMVSGQPVVITGEELLVFAAARQLPVPPGVAQLETLRLDKDKMEQRLVQAGRSLLARGVMPGRPEDGLEESPVAGQLAVVCDPEAQFVVAVGSVRSLKVRRFAGKEAAAFGHTWNRMGMHLVYEIDRTTVADAIVDAAELQPSADDEHACRVQVNAEELSRAVEQGATAVAELLREAADDPDTDDVSIAKLATAIVDGRKGVAL